MTQYDVAVIGGGPSGSTAAHLLAKGGARVLLLEREVFPRFHIGESLLPCNQPIFERLGVDIDAEPAHLRKLGAEFFDEAKDQRAVYYFRDSLGHTRAHSWQVDRARFDEVLLDAAEAAGAEVHQGEKVSAVDVSADGVRVRSERATYEARYLIDATGLDSFLARKHRTRDRLPFGIAAAYQHFEDLAPEVAADLATEGLVKVFFVDEGWLWAIPLGGARISIGLVTRSKGISDDWLGAAIAGSPELSRITDGATASGPPRRVGSFSFVNTRSHGARWCCVGDAACFLDPVFSSGVAFGMAGAAQVADLLLPALEEGREAAEELMVSHAAHMSDGYNAFGALIQALYQRRLLPGLLFTRSQDPELRRGLTSMLAGDVWQDGNRFHEMLKRSGRRKFDVTSRT